MIRIPILHAGAAEPFPPVDTALSEPNGLLAVGGDLAPARLLDAYRHGIFPWYSDDEPILWWAPDPRMVFSTGYVHISTRLHRWLRHCPWSIRCDTSFAAVVSACAAPRRGQPGTWITRAMFAAYAQLHALGHAHCVEVWDEDALVGGIYGVAVGRMFYGESMFSTAPNGSKVALIALCRGLHAWGFPMLDAQVPSPHLASMGAHPMPRAQFIAQVAALGSIDATPGNWRAIWTRGRACDLAHA
jgi:leucyl/phenylalanyl-tRNA---protein transferase